MNKIIVPSLVFFLLCMVFSCKHKEGTLDYSNAKSINQYWQGIAGRAVTETEKRRLYSEVLVELSSQRRSREALGLIQSLSGKGRIRATLVTELFASSHVPFSLRAGEYAELKEPLDRFAALSGITIFISQMETLENLPVTDVEKLGNGASRVLGEGLRGYVERRTKEGKVLAVTAAEAFETVDRLAAERGGEDAFRKDAIAKIAEAAPFEIWEAWRATENKEEGTEVLRVIASAMASVDPGRAMDTVLRDASGEGTSDIYRRWEAKAPAEASEWFAKNSKLVPQKERDWMLAHDSREALKDGKFQAAREAAWQMGDPKAKSDLEGAVWTKERELVRKEIAANPAATMDGMASGESAFTANWMEEGMTRWVDKDLPAAQSWYEKNWKNLKPDKAQYIAAAFAKQAARQGDPAAARQWAGHILEPKTKVRILAEIDKSPPPPAN